MKAGISLSNKGFGSDKRDGYVAAELRDVVCKHCYFDVAWHDELYTGDVK